MHLHLQPNIRLSVQPFDADLLSLAVDRFDVMLTLARFRLIQKPGIRRHVRLADGSEPHPIAFSIVI
jgi:hypothetical protein